MVDDGSGAELPPAGWSGRATGYPGDSSIVDLFARQVAEHADATALAEGGRRVTYAELDRWSGALATRLAETGVRAGDRVGLLGERCLEAPAGMLAILRAGGVYVPLDSTDPAGRLRTLIEQIGIRQVLRLPGADGLLPEVASIPVAAHREGPPPPRPATGGGDPAYVMFTSGSTGVPKAVAVPHRAVARLVLGDDDLRISAGDRVSHTGHPAFDASVFEIWGALLNGARLVIVDHPTLLDPARLAELFTRERITVAWLTAGVFHQCARARPGMFGGLRCLIAGGDVLDPALVGSVLASGPPSRMLNGYGPTENTTFSAVHHITEVPAGTVRIPIGRPIANSTCHIVGDDGEPVPVGAEGELWVGGDGVALGYLNDPAATAARFVPDRFSGRPGARLFRTGDRARWLPDGTIDFLGRRDRMLKIRGFRVELDEIEAVLAAADDVAAAAVVVTGDDPDTRAIVAYFQPVRPARPDDDPLPAIRAFLAARLPRFMLPARLVPVHHLPLAGTGKVDRAALAALGTGSDGPGRASPAGPRPRTPTEVGVARLWAEVLDLDPAEVGLDDGFFDLGGNSLLAARLFVRLQTMFGVDRSQSRFLTSRLLADPRLSACAAAVQEARTGLIDRDAAVLDADFRRESAGTAAVVARPRTPADDDEPTAPLRLAGGSILLTGATGFLGGYLLRRLLDTTEATIHCLVRAAGEDAARQRLAEGQHRYGLGDLPADRVRPVPGDLGRPGLGLPAAVFDELAARVDLILHAGAYVNFVYPYSQLAPVTVGGTREIVRLATPRGVPVHFVSTLAVLAGFGAAGVREVTEDTPLAHPELLFMGYTETKWVAEAVLGHAARDGLPVGIHRPYEVSGDLTHGAWNLENATCAMLRLMVDMGLAPAIDMSLDLVPVDVLAAQIVHIALTRTRQTRTYHLTNPGPATLADMTEVLRSHGYRIRTLPFDAWVSRAVEFVAENPHHPFTPFVPLWVDRCPRSGLVVKQMYFTSVFPRFGRGNAERALAGSGLSMPPVDAALLDHYVRFFRRSGYFPAPDADREVTDSRSGRA
ncbi:amino acid adenylation domain-containing protein [Actinoplanes sp. NPDC023801]|uniref:amino acid adenylation domain-containing protein n=1 Tax=Actinoplanes sp. NPDC023801 TaxID=3154595 RepID=UPI00340C2CDA